MQALPIAILGAAGRMGTTLIRLIQADPARYTLSGALGIADDPSLGVDAGVVAGGQPCGVALSANIEEALAGARVAIDFTLPAATSAHLQACRTHGVALVLGTTGIDDDGLRVLGDTARELPIVYARNFSVGVTLLTALTRQAAARLDSDYDVEIIEAHHRGKRDAPSGTALALGEAVAQGRDVTLAEVADWSRHGDTGARQRGHIGFAVVRGGSIVGEHSVLFAADEERLELSHHAVDRSVFARGALRAARWLAQRPPGLYDMEHVLGLGVGD
ncbi:MAG: 4-hydroxy-tetrahydrodipicolinate reductase [Gammaproteobacteria bacterium]|nr:4-hydroxy-tetrahydrodipicolinate reductase [Gammaproteobacteria bacterium]